MKSVRTLLLMFLVMCLGHVSVAQFWVGPRVGMHFTGYNYKEDPIPLDNGRALGKDSPDSIRYEYDVEGGSNFNFGLAFEYTTEGRYSVHTEIVYQRVNNIVKSQPGDPVLTSESTYNFITVPILVRINFGQSPLQFYLNAGPRLAYWLNGKGVVTADELEEFGVENNQRSYKVFFGSDDPGDAFVIPKANRLQYAFEAGGGVSYQLNESLRTYLDVRYTFGHSNMGFNDESDFGLLGYKESIQYSHRMFSFSVGFLFGYDPNNKRKGASNSRVGK